MLSINSKEAIISLLLVRGVQEEDNLLVDEDVREEEDNLIVDEDDCAKVLSSSRSYREGQDSVAEFLTTRIAAHPTSCLSTFVICFRGRTIYGAPYIWYIYNYIRVHK